MASEASHRRRKLAGDPDIAPDRGGRRRRSAEPVGLDRVRDDDPAPTVDDSGQGADTGEGGSTTWWARRRATRKTRKKAPWWELPVLVVVAVLVAIIVKTFVIQPFYIPSDSMEKTLHGCDTCRGDRIIVNKPIYTVVRDPHPGDIVVFRAPDGWTDEAPDTSPPSNPVLHGIRWFGQLVGVVPPDEKDLVKRVIAVGGQTVKCCDSKGNVQVSNNGPSGPFTSLSGSGYVFVDAGLESFGSLPFGPVTVPKGRLWVMGDHRNDSKDSRYYCGEPPSPTTPVCTNASPPTATTATVPVSNVIGKAVLIAWPPSRWTTLGTPDTFKSDHLPSASGGSLAGGGIAATGPVGSGLVVAGAVFRRRSRGRRD